MCKNAISLKTGKVSYNRLTHNNSSHVTQKTHKGIHSKIAVRYEYVCHFISYLTNFSFSSSISSLAAMQSLVSRKALRWPSSVRLWMKSPTRLTARKTRILAASCCQRSTSGPEASTRHTDTTVCTNASTTEKVVAIQLLQIHTLYLLLTEGSVPYLRSPCPNFVNY